MMRSWQIGASAEADIGIWSDGVSARQAELAFRDKGWWLRDLGSTNGTRVGPNRMTAEWYAIELTDLIAFARRVQLTAAQLVEKLADPPLAIALTLGAAADCDVVVEHPRVSNHHLLLLVAGRRWLVVDQHSSNGVWLNGERVERCDWPLDAELRLGSEVVGREQVVAVLAKLRGAVAELSGTWTVGADAACELPLALPAISGRHLQVRAQHGRWQVRDLGSSNGSWCDDARLGSEWTDTNAEANLRLGPIAMPLRQVALAAAAQQAKAGVVPAPAPHVVAPPAAERQSSKRVAAPLPAVETAQPAPVAPRPPPPAAPEPPVTAMPTPATSGGSGWLALLVVLALAAGGGWWFKNGRSHPMPGPSPTPQPAPEPTPSPSGDWQSAWDYAALRAAPATAASDSALSLATFGAPRGTAGASLPPAQADHLVETSYLRSRHDSSVYHTIPAEQLQGAQASGPATYQVNAGSLAADYLVPNLDRLAIRDQQSRGTCAAFASIGAIELTAIEQNQQLGTLDLSEQRFYWLAKPDCQADGCPGGSEGSSYEQGLQASQRAKLPDIPLERDCPYVGEVRATDTQVPQAASCTRGAVKVAQTQDIGSLQGVLDTLTRDKRPVVVGTSLSDNFMDPPASGIIAAADDTSRVQNKHTGGHAYLIVGYKRLPDMPSEGGICFVVRNSWGRTWGRSGFGCVTQRWLQQHDNQFSGMAVAQVQLAGQLAPPVPPPPPPPSHRDLALKSPKGTWVQGGLQESGDKGQFRLGLTAGGYSQPLELGLSGGRLAWQGKVVGEVDGSGKALLCSGRFVRACQLSFRSTDKALRIDLLSGQPQRALTASRADATQPWIQLGALPNGRALEVQIDPAQLVARLRLGGSDGGSVLELALRGTDVVLGGKVVGSVSPGNPGLCTGTWADACSVVIGSDGLDLAGW